MFRFNSGYFRRHKKFRSFIIQHFHRNQDGGFIFRTTTLLCNKFFVAKVAIIQLYQITQPLNCITNNHGATNLVHHNSNGVIIFYPQQRLQLQSRNTIFLVYSPINCQKPLLQLYKGFIKNNIGCNRYLIRALSFFS